MHQLSPRSVLFALCTTCVVLAPLVPAQAKKKPPIALAGRASPTSGKEAAAIKRVGKHKAVDVGLSLAFDTATTFSVSEDGARRFGGTYTTKKGKATLSPDAEELKVFLAERFASTTGAEILDSTLLSSKGDAKAKEKKGVASMLFKIKVKCAVVTPAGETTAKYSFKGSGPLGVIAVGPDDDGDGVENDRDNCPDDANAGQDLSLIHI